MVPSKQLFTIRIGLVAGVAIFAGFTAYQRAQGMLPSVSGDSMLEMMRYVLWGLSLAAVFAAIFLKARIEGATAPGAHVKLTLIGWAFGEGVALFGTAQHFAGGPIAPMALGLLTFIVVLILLPVPQTPQKLD